MKMIQLEMIINFDNFTSSTAFTSAFPLVINNLISLLLLAQCNGVLSLCYTKQVYMLLMLKLFCHRTKLLQLKLYKKITT